MKFAGFALLAAGFAFALHAYSPTRFDHRETAPVVAPEDIVRPEPARLSVARNFAIRPADAPSPAQNDVVTQTATVTALPGLPSASAVAFATSAEDTGNRATLVRRIQRELRRVGCYDGQIDGEWDRTLRTSMGQFIDRVNATLPHQEPDVVLLTLVRNHKAAVCGSGCPTGQAQDDTGRCLPDAILAKAQRRSGAKSVAQAPSEWTTTVTMNEVQPTAATLPPPPATKAPLAVARAQRPAPLPGKMAMGGPVNAPTAQAVSRNWWDTFITATPSDDGAREHTLDRPVGLTSVPQPRLVRRDASQLAGEGLQANLAAPIGADGASDGAALVPVELKPVAERVPRARSGKSYRKASKGKSRQRYASRSRGRNVQALFQHPLGRM